MQKKTGLSFSLQRLPEIPELNQLLAQAIEKRGKMLQLTWRDPKTQVQFTLEVFCRATGGDPKWVLYSQHKGQREVLFDYNSIDVLLVYNLMCSECTGNISKASQLATQNRLSAIQTGAAAPGPPKSPFEEMREAGAGAEGRESTARAKAISAGSAPAGAGEDSGIRVTSGPVGGRSADPKSAGSRPSLSHGSASSTGADRAGEDSGIRVTSGPMASSAPGSDSVIRVSSTPDSAIQVRSSADSAIRVSTSPMSTSGVNIPAVAQAPIAPSAPKVPAAGTLADVPIADLLIKVTDGDVTGKLEVQYSDTTAVVYIQDGVLVDATVSDAVGDDAIIELLTWKEGNFAFEQRTLRNRNTVRQDIKSLLAQSEQFARHTKALKDRGMRVTSILAPRNANLSQQEFNERVSDNCPTDLQTIGDFYLSLNGEKTVEQLQRDMLLSRIQMIHMIHHLVVHGVVDISNETAKQETLSLAVKPIDAAAIQAVMMSLRRVDTGMFLYPAFLYFLEQEYFRSYRSRSPFSIIVFEMRVASSADGKAVRRVLPNSAVIDAAARIGQVKRHQDLLAHYDAYDYALLLPNTKAAGARIFGNRVLKSLTERPLTDVDPAELLLAFGAATVPEDFTDLSSLLAGADLAMNQSRDKQQPLVLFQDIKHLVR